jgi:predicted transglutaminase-like cysteine proteinase
MAWAGTGCTSTPKSRSALISPAAAAIGRPQLATTQETSAPTDQTAFCRLADDACGLSGGCLIGASRAMLDKQQIDLARRANQQSQQHPAIPADAREHPTADLNGDGFVTLDELIAMRRAGVDDDQMIDRLRATGQVFALSPRQWQYLYERGINRPVLDAISNMGSPLASADRVH